MSFVDKTSVGMMAKMSKPAKSVAPDSGFSEKSFGYLSDKSNNSEREVYKHTDSMDLGSTGSTNSTDSAFSSDYMSSHGSNSSESNSSHGPANKNFNNMDNCSTGSTDSALGSEMSSTGSNGSKSNSDYLRYVQGNSSEFSRYSYSSMASDQGYNSNSNALESATVTEEPTSTKSKNIPMCQKSNTNTDKHFTGTFMQFVTMLAGIYDYRSWDPIKDIKEKLGPKLLEEARTVMWGQDEDKDFEALNAAREHDERAVAFSLFCAGSHKQLNTMNEDRQTVLHIAAETCSAHLCRLLITRGADGAIADVWGDTPLHIAARCGRADVIKALCTTLTRTEVRHPYFRVPYKSLPQDNVQSYNHDGRTPVHLAAQESHSEKHRAALVALVRYARADIDFRRMGDGYAPAHIAIDNNDYECLKTCLEIGADSEVRNFKSETPQQLAYLYNNKDANHKMVKLCQKHGAGSYQLEYAETESLDPDQGMDMDDEQEDCGAVGGHGIVHRFEQMNVC